MSGPEGEEGRLTLAHGLCARCGGAVPFGRLLVMPEAAECDGCG
jgi:RNA polymerase-binding transcription factor DksA